MTEFQTIDITTPETLNQGLITIAKSQGVSEGLIDTYFKILAMTHEKELLDFMIKEGYLTKESFKDYIDYYPKNKNVAFYIEISNNEVFVVKNSVFNHSAVAYVLNSGRMKITEKGYGLARQYYNFYVNEDFDYQDALIAKKSTKRFLANTFEPLVDDEYSFYISGFNLHALRMLLSGPASSSKDIPLNEKTSKLYRYVSLSEGVVNTILSERYDLVVIRVSPRLIRPKTDQVCVVFDTKYNLVSVHKELAKSLPLACGNGSATIISTK